MSTYTGVFECGMTC